MYSPFSSYFNIPICPYEGSDDITKPVSTGTTTIAAEFNEGVVIGADSRTTTGAIVANRIADKLTKISDNIYCCRSGSAADSQAISDIVSYHLDFHALELGEEPSVESCASVFRQLCYNHRDALLVGIIVAGWDRRKGGQVYSIPIGGMCLRQPLSIGGSGSTYVYGFTDANYKPNMSKEECVEFVTKAITLAMNRDGSSGGVARLGVITKDGVERRVISGKELPEYFTF